MDPTVASEAGTRASWARQILVQAALLGLLADAMLRDPPWGVGLTIWISALASTVALLVLRRGRLLPATPVRRRGRLGRREAPFQARPEAADSGFRFTRPASVLLFTSF